MAWLLVLILTYRGETTVSVISRFATKAGCEEGRVQLIRKLAGPDVKFRTFCDQR